MSAAKMGFAGSYFNWGQFLVSLKLFYETGTGTLS